MRKMKSIVNNLKTKNEMNVKNVIFLLLLLKSCMLLSQNLRAQKRIIIDVGHGGKDSGAIGINSILEKDVVLSIAKMILERNKSVLDSNYEIYLTRYHDTLISLSDRSRLAKTLDADLFISLHCNASAKVAKGMEVYISKKVSREAVGLALSILNESTQNLGLKKRKVKFANFQVLREMDGICPAVLVEFGFLTNETEAEYFLKTSNNRALALSVLMGVGRFFKDKSEKK